MDRIKKRINMKHNCNTWNQYKKTPGFNENIIMNEIVIKYSS